MRERERLLWSILIILLLIIAGYMGYNSYRIGQQVRDYREAMQREALGSEDPQLRETVEELESDLRNRMDYHFEIDHDPLDLSQVIYARRFLANLGFTESVESGSKMRLSCTVIAQQPAAVIKFRGRSNILRIGDTLNGYQLTKIEPEMAVLQRSGERLVLVTEKSPETMEIERQRKEGDITVSVPDTLAQTGNF